ncbi:FecR domain-containing protein [Methylobacillus gramineus]|uniref:FecR domain-containing protein n=1 Tax=Methylobacillus gramineus TaxID=755169 RepID=UPI001CFF91C0|nr:FecR domain-containing protein [Methylobacillus gramineus]MCB5185102.1 FecR domain-containing protein [Methylobacillus gramineus]
MSHNAELTALQQAAEWFAVLRDDQVREHDRHAWQTWFNASPLHQTAWQEVEAINSPFHQLSDIAIKPAALNALNRPTSRRQALKLLGFAGTALISGMLLKRYSPWQDWATTLTASAETHSTMLGKTGMLPLADGGKLWLNTHSQVKVEYGMTLRRIRLIAGEILLQSGKDTDQPSRPLVVDTPHGRLTALGTRFSVQQQAQHTLLAVYDGQVAISPKQGKSFIIVAGWQARFDASHIEHPQPASLAREAWTRGTLIADNRRLDDFIAELGNYFPGKLSVAPEIAHLRLMGAYPFSNVPLVLDEIANTLPLKLQHSTSNTIELVPRP